MSTEVTPEAAPFDPRRWAKRWRANYDEAARNTFTDSGWNKATAERCSDTAYTLLYDLFEQLRSVELKPEDFFDRPALAAVLSAVAEASKPEAP